MTDKEPPDELELTAHMTDSDAVRRVFDASNAMWTAIQAAIFTIADVFMFLFSFFSKSAAQRSWLAALLMVPVSAAAARIAYQLRAERGVASRGETARAVSRSLSDWIFGYFVAQFTVCVYAGAKTSPMAWGVIFPWILLGLRLSLARRIALNATLYGVAMAFMYLRDPRFTVRVALIYAMIYAVATMFGALNSRRVRRRTVDEWSERRASALEQLRMRGELRYARELQISMLPDAPPQLDWAEVAGTSIPATEVGGDYFDYIELDGSLAIVCGDVAGHGLASGITLSALRGGITLLRQEFTNPATVLERLHEVVTESSRRRTLVTMTAVLFDPRRGIATIANAGHPPVLVRRASGHVETIELFNPPLGVRRNETIPQREVPFAPSDVFLMHSDGIYETINGGGEQYGLDRLTALLATLGGSANEVRDAVLRSVAEFRGNAQQQDDVTVVVVRIGERASRPQ